MNQTRTATGKLPNASSPSVPFEDDFFKVDNQFNLFATAFMRACPEYNEGMCSLGRNPFKCTKDCGAIKDFFYNLETSNQ